jgi:carbon monoxide dehydrogenase subunit G
MKAFETEVQIDRPVQDVWRELTDWERAGRWMPGVETMRRNGSTLTFRTRGKERTSTVAESVAGSSVTLESVQGGVTARYVYALAPSGEGTRASLSADVVTTGVTTLFGPLIRAAVKRTDSGQLARLREVVEGTRS